MKKFLWILVAFVLSSLPMEATAQFAYGPAPENAMGLFAGFEADQSGNFTPLAGSPFGPDTGLTSMAVNPVTNLLYASYFDPPSRSNPNRIQGRVQPYRIDSAGTPEPIGHPLAYYPPSELPGLILISSGIGLMSPSGTYLCMVNTWTDEEGFGARTNLQFVRILKSGSLTYTPKDVYQFGNGIQMIAGHPSGAFFFGEDSGSVLGFRVESNFTLTPISVSALPGPWSIGFDRSGKYFYEFFNPGTPYIGLGVFTVGSDGSLAPIAGSPFTDPTGGFDVTNPLFFHPNGKYVYALGYPPQTGVPGRIYGYSIASNGQLVPLPGSPYQLPGAQFIAPELSMAMDPDGNFITVSNPVNNQTYANWVYLIEPDGTLKPGPNSPSSTIPPISCFVGSPK
jgi:hypothetical protein